MIKKEVQCSTTRVFTLGIGNEWSHELVRGAAKAGKGSCEIVTNDSMIVEASIGLLQSAFLPAFSVTTFEYNPEDLVYCFPAMEPFDLITSGKKFSFCGILLKSAEAKGGSEIRIELENFKTKALQQLKVPLRIEGSSDSSAIHKILANKIIRGSKKQREAEAGYFSFGGKKLGNDGEVEQEIIKMSLKYGVLSTKTAFFVKEKSKKPNTPFEETQADMGTVILRDDAVLSLTI